MDHEEWRPPSGERRSPFVEGSIAELVERVTPLDRRLAGFQRSDMGNGERLRERFGEYLLYVREVGWHVWAASHWEREGADDAAAILAQETAEAMKLEAAAVLGIGRATGESDKDYADRVESAWKWAIGCGNQARLANMLATAVPHCHVDVESLDRDHMLLNLPNGTVQLGPGPKVELREHRRADRISKVLPVAFEPAADCPRWRAFLDMILPDPAVQTFVQRFFGYSLTGRTDEECLLILYGGGANGKSTLVDMVLWVMGAYASSLPVASLMQDRNKSGAEATPDLARLPGKRLVATGEPNAEARLAEGTIKLWTGGDRVSARHLNRGFFDFKPEFKLVLSTNKKPRVRGQDHGIWRRLRLVPFDVTITNVRRKADVLAEFRAEAAGILNWLLDGYRCWAERGLDAPPGVMMATDAWREDSDPVGEFLKASVIPAAGERVGARELYDAYHRWCQASALRAYSQTAFGRAVQERGWHRIKSSVVFYDNMHLIGGGDDASVEEDQ